MVFTLHKDNVEVEVVNFSIERTYEGVYALDESRRKAFNNRILNEIQFNKKEDLNVPVQLLLDDKEVNLSKRLPEHVCRVTLEGYPLDERNHFSIMQAVFFTDLVLTASIRELMEIPIRMIDWKKNAKDYQL